jgi:hypothetical protein
MSYVEENLNERKISAAAALPLLPVVLTIMPLDELLSHLVKRIFWTSWELIAVYLLPNVQPSPELVP